MTINSHTHYFLQRVTTYGRTTTFRIDLYQFTLWAYVLMPAHVHILAWPTQKSYDIAFNVGKG